jgi:hypothetical protein
VEIESTCRGPLPLLSHRSDVALCEIEACSQSWYSLIQCLLRRASWHNLEVLYLHIVSSPIKRHLRSQLQRRVDLSVAQDKPYAASAHPRCRLDHFGVLSNLSG